MEPLSLLCRLAACVPPPHFHAVRYAGVLAGASPWRPRAAAGLTFPFPWRWRLAQDGALVGQLTRVFVETVQAFYSCRGAREGVRGAQTGTVTVVPRTGAKSRTCRCGVDLPPRARLCNACRDAVQNASQPSSRGRASCSCRGRVSPRCACRRGRVLEDRFLPLPQSVARRIIWRMADPAWVGDAQGGLIVAALVTLPAIWWKWRSDWRGWSAGVVWLLAAVPTAYYSLRGLVSPATAFMGLRPPLWIPFWAGIVVGALFVLVVRRVPRAQEPVRPRRRQRRNPRRQLKALRPSPRRKMPSWRSQPRTERS